eukprot:scaffold31967_cov66-Phaeocystis_antarctica.AAC.1
MTFDTMVKVCKAYIYLGMTLVTYHMFQRGAGSQLQSCSRQLTSQHRQHILLYVPAQVLVRLQRVEDAEPLERPAARPRHVARRRDANSLVQGVLGVAREETEQELAHGLRVGSLHVLIAPLLLFLR